MNLITVQDDVEMISQVNTWLENSISKSVSKQKIIHLPAGNTPLALYKAWENEPPVFLNEVLFQQVDDVLTGLRAGMFKIFFEEQLPSYQKQFLPLTESPVKPAIAILGVGTNGHLAFHEPEVNFCFNYGCISLSSSTCKNLNLPEPSWGISYGAGHFLQCESILIIARGESKKSIVQQTLNEKTPTTPFSFILKAHPNCILIIDR